MVDTIKSFYGNQPAKNVIWDWTGSDPSQLTTSDVEKLANSPARYSDLRKGGRTAMVAPDDLSFGISRMFQTFGDMNGLPFIFKVFHSLGDAFLWISNPENKP